MNQLAHCVLHYARSLWESQQLLPPNDALDAQASPHARASLYLASLADSVAGLPEAQRVDLARAARRGWPLRVAGTVEDAPDPVRVALMSGRAPTPLHALPAGLTPWRDASLAAIALRSLRYALELAALLPDPTLQPIADDASPLLLTAAAAVDEQQALLWDAIERVGADEAAQLAAAARAMLETAASGDQEAELLAYFASGMFAQRVSAHR
ncbi:hypothetical protein [Pseudoxanthomonas winnipegensis]|jgi:hypothetical protein|uniref:Uncharacterized protein n=2 Tax=Pseudoxanthomonas TaxID=83618 RepID=A0A4Q8L8G3_9GAMM|nr:hypothetical protein [Pseudoxanthomonas winnipegensis]TAA24555.1 hypothetical protein EA660_12600 [Pseudoxanthomonas winnipegensis]